MRFFKRLEEKTISSHEYPRPCISGYPMAMLTPAAAKKVGNEVRNHDLSSRQEFQKAKVAIGRRAIGGGTQDDAVDETVAERWV